MNTSQYNKSGKRVGIVIPVYNAKDYLNDCLCSILTQSYIDIILILVDDGSTDNSGMLCDKYAKDDTRIRVLHVKNGGPAKARNTGLSLIENEEDVRYVIFVDADDYLEKDAIHVLVDKAECVNADIVVGVSCGLRNGKFIYRRDLGSEKDQFYLKDGIVNRVRNFLRNPYESFIASVVWARLYRTSIIFNNKIRFDESLKTYEDMTFNFECLKFASSIFFIDKVVYHHRLYDAFVSSNTCATEGTEQFFEAPNIALNNAKKYLELNHIPNIEITKEIGNAIMHHMIRQLIKLCWQLDNENKKSIYNFVSNLVRSRITRENICYYKTIDGESDIVPILIKLKTVKLLMIVCQSMGLKKYGKLRGAK